MRASCNHQVGRIHESGNQRVKVKGACFSLLPEPDGGICASRPHNFVLSVQLSQFADGEILPPEDTVRVSLNLKLRLSHDLSELPERVDQ